MSELDFIHRFVPAKPDSASPRTLLLLHGTGGNEDDLLDLGRAIGSTAALLSPRGKVLENGAPRFFRRLAEGVFDEADVVRRANELAAFVDAAAGEYQIDLTRLVAVGYSNGANIAAAMLLLDLAQFSQAILLRPMTPLSKVELPNLKGKRLLLCGGQFDPIAQPSIVRELGEIFNKAGAEVTLRLQQSGHELSAADVETARQWLEQE